MIESILSKLNSIPADKVFHFAGGAILFALALPFLSATYALAAVLIAGFAKEVYDFCHKDKHTPDIWDSLATFAGGSICYFCTYF